MSWVASGLERGPVVATGWPLPDGETVGDGVGEAVAFAAGVGDAVTVVAGEVVAVGDGFTVGEVAMDGEGDTLGSGVGSITRGKSEDEAAGPNNWG